MIRLSREAQSNALAYEDVGSAWSAEGGQKTGTGTFAKLFFRKLREVVPLVARIVIALSAVMIIYGTVRGEDGNVRESGKSVATASNQLLVADVTSEEPLVGEGKTEESPVITVHDIAEEDMNWEIFVNHVWNTVTVYTETYPGSGEFDYPYKAITVSVGLGNNTKLGTYTVGAPEGKEWHYLMQEMDGGSWCQYLVRFQSSRLFHSCTYSPPGNRGDFATFKHNTLNINMFNNLGNAASHGCIRMQAGDAYWMYTHIKEGTTVIIENDYDSPGPLGKPVIQRISSKCPAPYRNWDPTDPDENNPWLETTEEQRVEWLIDAEYEDPVKPSEKSETNSVEAATGMAISLQLNSADGILHLMLNPSYEQIKANFGCYFDDGDSPTSWNLYFEGPHNLEVPGQYTVTAYAMDIETNVKSAPISVTIQVEQPVQPDPLTDQP